MKDELEVFKEVYSGETIFTDLFEDICMDLDSSNNDTMKKIPIDSVGFMEGSFEVTIKWRNE